jgi:translation elongation factor EF-1alpha
MLGVDPRHALLVKSNGINKLVVVINKMDDRKYKARSGALTSPADSMLSI